ncbi:MAG: PIN domain-containing protein [Crocinitomicaceae bacterium]|nr:PIN domain-containing protein [Crocinitomicaceae bacterium]MBK8924701.1 PIN domain-containing protein [Crocinitomicaceae bacterium]
MKNLFLDTNVIIDTLADRKPFSRAGAKLFQYAEKDKINLFISALSYSNIYYIIRKTCTHKEMLRTLIDLESLIETVDVTKQIIAKSLNSDFKDYEDSIQYYTALSNKKITAIVTRNVKDFKKSDLAVLTPEEALGIIESVG